MPEQIPNSLEKSARRWEAEGVSVLMYTAVRSSRASFPSGHRLTIIGGSAAARRQDNGG